jgi:hypothetical protein
LRDPKSVRTVSRALCLYDSAGEHFQAMSEAELSPATDHLALSEALIFVLDPLQHPKFRRLCREHSDDPQLSSEFRCYRQDEILLEAAKRIRQKANIAVHERFKRPLVVAVNKYDTWGTLLPDLELRNISPYCRLNGGQQALDLSTLAMVSRKVEKLLRQTAPELVVACEGFCDDVIYLPVSPQGCAPLRTEGDRLGVRPIDLCPTWAEVPLVYSISRSKCALVPKAEDTQNRRFGSLASDDEENLPPHIYRGAS